MADLRTLVRDQMERAGSPSYSFDDLCRRRDRKRRKQRITAGIVGFAVFVAAVWIVRDIASLNSSQTSVVPGASGTTGPVETGPAETGPAETGPTEAIGPVPESNYLLDLDTGEMTPLPESIAGERPSEFAASPDGTRLAYVDRGDNGEPQIFVANLDGTGIEQVTYDLEAASSPAWSPDGSQIAYIRGLSAHHLQELFVLDLASGESTQLTFATDEPDPAAPDLGPWEADSPSFTPDGSSIVYGMHREDSFGDAVEFEMRMVPIAGSESVRLADGGWSGALSPDGSLLSYDCPTRGAICVANADGSDERVVVPSTPPDALGSGDWSPDGTRIAYSNFHGYDVSIVDVATGQSTYVGEGHAPTWLDDHTLIIEMDDCYDPDNEGWGGQGCNGG